MFEHIKTTKRIVRGFALLTPEQRKVVASRGGIAAHKHGAAHQWNAAEAREAGKKGGRAKKPKKNQ